MAYIGTQPKDIRSFGKAKFDFTATQGQTSFYGLDDDGKTLHFTAGQITVYLNGILLDESDYWFYDGTELNLNSPANAGDILSVVALQTDIPNSDYVPATGGTFSGDVTHTGTFTSRGIDDNATSTVVTLDASGNVLVGTTDSNPVANNINSGVQIGDGRIRASRADRAVIEMNRKTSDGSIAEFRKDGTTVGSIGSYAGDLIIGTGDTYLRFEDAYDVISPRNANGTGRDAAVSLGVSSVRFKDLYLSGGVYLGGTGVANLLDDYEEGTWTPAIIGGTTNPTVTYSDNYGYYTKVGRLVHVYGRTQISTISGGAGYLFISGLPFTVNSSAGRYATGSTGYTGGWNTVTPLALIAPHSTTRFEMYGATGTSARGSVTSIIYLSYAQAGSDIIYSLTYETT